MVQILDLVELHTFLDEVVACDQIVLYCKLKEVVFQFTVSDLDDV